MTMPPDILTFLLRGGHLNVEERKAKGLSPSERLRYSEVLDHLAAVIEQEEWFPRVIPMQQPIDLYYDGIIIQKISRNHFVCHGCRVLRVRGGHPTHECRRARDAAAFYLKWELGIPPGTLDSWIVE